MPLSTKKVPDPMLRCQEKQTSRYKNTSCMSSRESDHKQKGPSGVRNRSQLSEDLFINQLAHLVLRKDFSSSKNSGFGRISSDDEN